MEGLRSRGAAANPNVKVTSYENGLWMGRSSPSFEPKPKSSSPRKKERFAKVNDPSWTSDNTWWNDPEAKRKRRVAKYKLYGTQSKIKHSLKAGYRWVKIRCARIISRT
ncbi:hypothetical protein L6164_013117 [Bauhinia variegata]|uniref:Uncharacterized protein n=1 Tax=Bauhinia variegata TaxID=167791 RepID=A0ACB9PB32_BAUVA|nr:hypothetical protein L6164_013117 [Bauhinia variegata]